MPSLNAIGRFFADVPRFVGAAGFRAAVFVLPVDRRLDLFAAGLRREAFLAGDFLAELFLDADFLLVDLFAADFLRVDLFAADFLRVDFFAADFLRVDFFAAPPRRPAFRAVFFLPPFRAAIGILLFY